MSSILTSLAGYCRVYRGTPTDRYSFYTQRSPPGVPGRLFVRPYRDKGCAKRCHTAIGIRAVQSDVTP